MDFRVQPEYIRSPLQYTLYLFTLVGYGASQSGW